jgi:hypothetical protein
MSLGCYRPRFRPICLRTIDSALFFRFNATNVLGQLTMRDLHSCEDIQRAGNHAMTLNIGRVAGFISAVAFGHPR